MDNFEQQLRRHYESQRLSPERVQQILAAGRAAAATRRRRAFWFPVGAVAAGLLLGLIWWNTGPHALLPTAPPVIAASSVADAVTAYFTPMDYQLAKVSADREELVAWLRAQGGPANFEVPPALARLSSYGCQVLDVQGQRVFLICFLLEEPAAAAPAEGGMPAKKMMVTTGPDGQMMKKTVPLVHLVVAAKSQFASLPKPGERVVQPGQPEWHYATWTQGDQVYLAAGAVPADRLAGLVKAL